MAQANLLYDTEVSPEDFEEIGLIAWNFIGNKRSRLYRYCIESNCGDIEIDMPCNFESIESITHGCNTCDCNTHNSQYYTQGDFVRYDRVGDKIYLKESGPVTVLYKGNVVDEDGLPELTDKEVDAIACYVAYTVKFKDAIRTNNGNSMQIATMLQQRWLQLCDAARVPQDISQNEMNEILEAKTNWNRKSFRASLKPIK